MIRFRSRASLGVRAASAGAAVVIGAALVALVAGYASVTGGGPAAVPVASAPATPQSPGVYVTYVPASTTVKARDDIAVTLRIDNTTGHAVQVDDATCIAWFAFGLVKEGSPTPETFFPQPACPVASLAPGVTTKASKIQTGPAEPGTYTTYAASSGDVRADVHFSAPVTIRIQP